MKLLLTISFFGCTLTTSLIAQIDPTKGTGRTTRVFHAEPTVAPNSFEELLSLSPLVVVGTVDAVLPARLTDKSNPSSAVESDVVFLIDKVVKGGALDSQKGLKRVLLSQLGGKYQGQLIVPSEESLLEPGERDLLFLAPDARKDRPDIAGLHRYLIVGIWMGKFRSERLGGMHASSKAFPGLHAIDSKSEVEFISSLLALILKNPILGQ
jgi:hypothetical protein